MEGSRLKILCITGWCRNGSTIMGNVLNEIPGFFHVGEIHFLWKNAAGKGSNVLCGCGTPLAECSIWSRIVPLGRPAGASAEEYAAAIRRRQLAYVRTRHTWRVLNRGLDSEGIREHAALMARTYHAVADLTGARVIVDTTKIPGEAALLPHLEGVDPYFVQLVRDPRAVAESWRVPKQYAYVMPSWKSTAYWTGFNLASQAIIRRYPRRSLFLRYEEFIADPQGAMEKLLRLCAEDPALNPLRGRSIDLRPNHTVTGNPDRFRHGPTVIKERDDSWKTGLSWHARLAAVTLSWPLFKRYGYGREGAVRPAAVSLGAAAPTATREP
jgi:sulfotransferase family protein